MKALRILILCAVGACADFLLTQCCDPEPIPVSISCIRAELIDNSGLYAVTSPDDEIDKDAFGIRIVFMDEFNPCMRHIQGMFFQSAYASSCIENYVFTDEVTELHFISGNDFNSGHAAGSDVTEYFRVLMQEHPNRDLFTLADAMDAGIPQGFDDSDGGYSTVDLLLMTPPDVTGPHSFYINLSLSNGTIFQDTVNVTLL